MGLWARLWAAGFEVLGKRFQKVEGPYRERLVSEVAGEVLEVGAGTGFNFTHYRAASRVVAIEPEDAMRSRAVRRAADAQVPVEVRPGNAHRLDFPDGSFDAVIYSLVLCTIPDPALALTEAKRVLRPGGEIRFYEHVRSTDPAVARRQDRILKPWRAFNRGCHPNRDTPATISEAGFEIREMERFDQAGVPKVAKPHILGSAVKGTA